MKFNIFLLLATSMLATPAGAEVYMPVSKIDAVTVYPQGADITRLMKVSMAAGEHELVLADLPGSIDAQSIRVSGEGGAGLEIASVDSKTVPLQSVDLDSQRLTLEKQVSALADERAALDQVMADAEIQRQFLLSLANKQLTPVSTTQTAVEVNAASLNGLLDVMGQRLAALATLTQSAKLKQKDIDERSTDLQIKLSTLAPVQGYRTSVTVHLVAGNAGEGVFSVRYRVNEASWQPYYDARLSTPVAGKTAGVELVRRAEVMQATAENWEGVALTLSTARPGGATTVPEIGEDEIFARDARAKAAGNVAPAATEFLDDGEFKNELRGEDVAQAPELAKPKLDAVMQRQAIIAIAGFDANYVIQGRVSIDDSGTSKKVRIASHAVEAKLEAVSVPRLDSNAYLTARFVVDQGGALLPGVVNLYRDGVYVGQGALPLLTSGEGAKLGFGADDQVKVKRAEIKRRTGEEGIITASNVEERAWDITVSNLHDFSLPVTILDRVPYATKDDIVVTEIADLTPVTLRDVDKKRGVLSWSFELDSKGEKSIKTGYKVSWPKSMQISAVD